ncbi:UDP-N-acetylmuramoyl-tripeptide--D-alanyl-D-alanine ligase [Conyzicola lurida]|uniref:UDP-N-acetylmuramoyl-tripeptide--D-alanyl-D-alanine ligase n=1 Tax=Conyzicola lurida TaxID=1172621 RepID=A0A841AJ43_9MICO|nr:UDP-N-acetylmuramoyl-tripeptide--D-alanyl-D-alanine ligase [Conyzicola lurida]MBB5843920.1 UDP-N-acetylmuramoyl-tripeptide--D-alanyl-D-alanine ligase [Conyzicola lurida]
MTIVLIASIVVGVYAAVVGAAKWLRVAQREHYIAPWVTRLAWLWVTVRVTNAVLLAVAVVLIAVAILVPAVQFLAPLVVLLLSFLPIGLGIRGTSAKLAWTDRLKRLTGVWAALVLVVGAALTLLVGPAGIALTVLALAPITDLALVIMKPVEKRLSRKYMLSARKRLQQVRPTIVAITGSYGKTSTKGYVAHVLASSFAVVASPASFNNLMGLSSAVNNRVIPGTEVFIAEMGVYGRGEIRELSESFPPDIAAITTIGEAHLARMGSREVIFQAKSEITEKARIVVLPIDEVELAGLAERCRVEGKTVITVSTRPGTDADVMVDADAGTVTVIEGTTVATAPIHVPGVGHAVNLAVAIGIARALDIPLAKIADRLSALPDSPHRAEVQQAASGVVVIDDTYNSNPVGSERALQGAAVIAAERGGPLVVVTPGMVELGHVQAARNEAFAASVAALGGHLFAIARVNRAALVKGAAGGPNPVRTFDTRTEAVAAALDQAGDRGVILYENDLPDHYP